MPYSLKHLRQGSQHSLVLVDNTTTLPVLFCSIYSTRKLSLLRFRTQKKELLSLKYFYVFWLKKTGKTFDYSLYESHYDIALFIPELNTFFHYLLSKQHLDAQKNLELISFIGQVTHQARNNYTGHIRAVAKFLFYLNQRYMNSRYQKLVVYDLNKIRDWNTQILKSTIREFSKIPAQSTLKNGQYKSITKEQMIQLNNMLLPSSPAFFDDKSGKYFNAVDNLFNPFNSLFLQYRTFLIHRLMFNYGLRVGEILLLTTDSLGTSQPDSHGKTHYLLSVQNLPDGFDDSRSQPITLKNEYSSRIIELDKDDYHYLIIFVTSLRLPLFSSISPKDYPPIDHGFLFITNRGQCQPLTYDSIRKIYQKIDNKFISLYPNYRKGPSYLQMIGLTPHVGRHTWAFTTLEFIYHKLMNEELFLKKEYGISSRMKSLLDAAAEQLRILGGWSVTSKMPYKYARRFVSRIANESNLKRTKIDNHHKKILEPYNNNEGDYDPFI